MLSRFLVLAAALAASPVYTYTITPFKVSLSSEIPALKAQLAATRLPSSPITGADNDDYGISLATLKTLKNEWLAFDWDAEEKRLNSYKQYTTVIDNTTIHFVHEKSSHSGAIPIIITHGWPGSFNEYLPVVRPLLESAIGTFANGTKRNVSFDVVLPSIPGFTFSSPPPTVAGRDITNYSNLFNELMVNVLGYKHGYAVAGSDWGGGISWHTYDLHPESVRAAYLNFFPFIPPSAAEVAAANQTLTPFEQLGSERTNNWTDTGIGYFSEQTTRPNTIGLALNDNAVGQLAWVGEKFLQWSDPSGDLNHKDIITGAALYYLTKSFQSSVFIYGFNPHGFQTTIRKANTSAPLGYGDFKWDVGQWPRYIVEEIGNLVFYRQHDKGGHFPGTDNPVQYVQDLRDFLAEHFTFTS